MEWKDTSAIRSKSYTCGYCGNPLASNKGYFATSYSSQLKKQIATEYVYICHYCGSPTYFDSKNVQTPGPPFGGNVTHIPSKEVKALYEEARNCMKVNAYTAAAMCCRKLLMNVAVTETAKKGQRFEYYVDYLANEGYLGAKARPWVDHIRDKGNEANHEIEMVERQDAERLIQFCEMMLKTMYEYPAKIELTTKEPRNRKKKGGDRKQYPGVPPSPTPSE